MSNPRERTPEDSTGLLEDRIMDNLADEATPVPRGSRLPFAQELEWLTQDISCETLEDLPPPEAAAQITLWTIHWRRLEGAVPESLYRKCRGVLNLLLEACARYPDTLPRIPALDPNLPLDLGQEEVRARTLLREGTARRAEGGWKKDLLQTAHELGIDPAVPRERAERNPAGEAA
jgi:hypothetical protein